MAGVMVLCAMPAATRALKMFRDAEFTGGAALGAVRLKDFQKPVQWRRLTEVCDKPQLFSVIEAGRSSTR
eukprot:2653544-Amphidinium_carterae.1